MGKPEFSVQFEMKNFKPEDINLSTKYGKLTITGKFSSVWVYSYFHAWSYTPYNSILLTKEDNSMPVYH